jgi:hypothetical protein
MTDRFATNAKWHSTADTQNSRLSLQERILSGAVPPQFLGSEGLGSGSLFSSVAHRGKQMKQIANLIDNGVDDQLSFQVKGGDGNIIKDPFKYQGKMVYPDKNGWIRKTNTAPVKLAREIRLFQEHETNKLMEVLLLGDDVAAFTVGLSLDDWLECCDSGNVPEGDDSEWDKELQDEKCTIQSIEGTVAGSQLQTRKLSKLRKIAKFYLKNVDMEDFDTPAEKKADMKHGMNRGKPMDGEDLSEVVSDSTGSGASGNGSRRGSKGSDGVMAYGTV